jgi:hypothetical protein
LSLVNHIHTEMKRLLTLFLIICIGALSGNAFGQDKKTQDKKGGFSVGGYDNTRQEQQAPATKRSVVIPEEAAPAEKSVEEAMPEPAAAPAPAKAPQAPAPAMAPPAPEGKDTGQEKSTTARDKEKAKKSKSKGNRR